MRAGDAGRGRSPQADRLFDFDDDQLQIEHASGCHRKSPCADPTIAGDRAQVRGDRRQVPSDRGGDRNAERRSHLPWRRAARKEFPGSVGLPSVMMGLRPIRLPVTAGGLQPGPRSRATVARPYGG
jgi:hypothetical protein